MPRAITLAATPAQFEQLRQQGEAILPGKRMAAPRNTVVTVRSGDNSLQARVLKLSPTNGVGCADITLALAS